MSDASLVVERDGSVARLILNRPDFGNAIDLELARSLMHAAIACDEDDSIRCVLLTGAGRFFCVGGDVGALAAAANKLPSLLKELTTYTHSAVSRFARMGKPLVTAINGPAAGAGLSLAVLGDIALAGRAAHFTSAYTAIGLSPDGGATWLLPRLIGLRRAQQMVLTNQRVGAQEAAALGLVTRMVEDAELAAEANAIAVRLASAATFALGKARNLLLASLGASLEEQMEAEARAIAEAGRSAQGREGLDAFMAKRDAEF